MDYKEQILKLIQDYGEEDDFTGVSNSANILKVEEMLGLKLPKSYKWFIENYGHGGINGVEVYGISKADIPSCVRHTNNYRQYGLPVELVVIENCDEWLYCIDTGKMVDDECPIVRWDKNSKSTFLSFNNFYEYLYNRFNDNIDWYLAIKAGFRNVSGSNFIFSLKLVIP